MNSPEDDTKAGEEQVADGSVSPGAPPASKPPSGSAKTRKQKRRKATRQARKARRAERANALAAGSQSGPPSNATATIKNAAAAPTASPESIGRDEKAVKATARGDNKTVESTPHADEATAQRTKAVPTGAPARGNASTATTPRSDDAAKATARSDEVVESTARADEPAKATASTKPAPPGAITKPAPTGAPARGEEALPSLRGGTAQPSDAARSVREHAKTDPTDSPALAPIIGDETAESTPVPIRERAKTDPVESAPLALAPISGDETAESTPIPIRERAKTEPSDATALGSEPTEPGPTSGPELASIGLAETMPLLDQATRDEVVASTSQPVRERAKTEPSDAPPVSLLDRAIADATDYAGRAEQLSNELDALATTDPAGAAAIAYQLGELCELRRSNLDHALSAYQRAFELDPSLPATRWAIRRILHDRAAWQELEQHLDAELRHAAEDDERATVWFEQARIAECRGNEGNARTALEHVTRLAPRHAAALVALDRVVARDPDRRIGIDVCERLAEACDHPELAIAYWLEVARSAAGDDVQRSLRALHRAAELATRVARWPLVIRVARERVWIADQHGTPAQIDAALEALAQLGIASDDSGSSDETRARRELAALRRRQAQRARDDAPLRSWQYLSQALDLAPCEPVVLADMIELAAELDRQDQLGTLLHTFCELEGERGRMSMISWWCADAHRDPKRRKQWRALRGPLSELVPGSLLLTSAAECDALAGASERGIEIDLADAYVAAARAAASGTWSGAPSAPLVHLQAAVALYVQAAYLFGYYVADPAAVDRARDVLDEASAVLPDHPAILESAIDLDELTGDLGETFIRLHESATIKPDRATIERLIRLAYRTGEPENVLDVQRELLQKDPTDFAVAWQLEALLSEVGTDAERADLLDWLAREDSDPDRRYTALLALAPLRESASDLAGAIDAYRQMIALRPDQSIAREALIALLRSQERWTELAAECRAAARASTDVSVIRRALQEASWVVEIWLDDPPQAAAVYAEWLARIPGDRAALEGSARCQAVLRDYAAEASARGEIAELDKTPEAWWLYARSLERAGRHRDAADCYRAVIATSEASIPSMSAALALGYIAARDSDLTTSVEAAETLAGRTTDSRMASALLDDAGWMYLLGLDDVDRASESFDAALQLQSDRAGALLGAAMVAARRGMWQRLAETWQMLAPTQPAEVAAAMLARAVVIAAAGNDTALAAARLAEVRRAHPESTHAVLLAVELDSATAAADEPDEDHLLARAELLAARSKLADDAVARTSWQLDQAEALEAAGDLLEAESVVAAVLEVKPGDWRALIALRRLAQRTDQPSIWAAASYQLAELARQPDAKLQLLRDAISVYDGAGAGSNRDYARAIYRRLVALGAGTAELERLLAVSRNRASRGHLLEALTLRLSSLEVTAGNESRILSLLLERAWLFNELGRRDVAARDLDAILERAATHFEALQLRTHIALETGEVRRALALCKRYCRLVAPQSRPPEIDQLLARVLNDPGLPAFDEDTTLAREREAIARELETQPRGRIAKRDHAQPPAPRRRITNGAPLDEPAPAADLAIQEQERSGRAKSVSVFDEPTPVRDVSALQQLEQLDRATRGKKSNLFDEPTPVADLSALQKQEQSVAREESRAGKEFTSDGDTFTGFEQRPLHVPTMDIDELVRSTLAADDWVEVVPTLDLGSLKPAPSGDLSLDSEVVVMPYETAHPARPNDAADILQLCELELELADDPTRIAMLRLEAGRLAENVGDPDRAAQHYNAALAVAPNAPAALRGLRRLARAKGDQVEVARLVAAECGMSSPRERDTLLRYQIDLLLALGQRDAAVAAVRELVAMNPLDVSALLVHLELAGSLDDGDVLAVTLGAVAEMMTDLGLRSTLQTARGLVASRRGDLAAATAWFAAAEQTDGTSPATRLRAIRRAGTQGRSDVVSAALLDVAFHVEADDPITAAALALRSLMWASDAEMTVAPEDAASLRQMIAEAAQLAVRAAPKDRLVAKVTTETVFISDPDRTIASNAFLRWARSTSVTIERAYATASAAELEPERLGRMWAQVLDLEPGNEYAAERLRAFYVATGAGQSAAQLDLQVATSTQRELPILRAAVGLIEQDQVDAAIELLSTARDQHSRSDAISQALADCLGHAARWSDRARVLREIAIAPSSTARGVARLRAALAAEKALIAADAEQAAPKRIEHAIVMALEAWSLVLEDFPHAAFAHAAAILLATRFADRTILNDVLARAQAAERSPWAASSLALRRSRVALGVDPRQAEDILRETTLHIDDPRRVVPMVVAAAYRRELADAARAHEERATRLLERGYSDPSWLPEQGDAVIEAAMLGLRAAQLALDGNHTERALESLARAETVLPEAVDDLRAVARERAGQPAIASVARDTTPLTRLLRDADRATEVGDHALALALYQRARDRHPEDPFVMPPLLRSATKLADADAVTAIALDQLRLADAVVDLRARADAYALLARTDYEMRRDVSSATVALENACNADPSRLDLVHRLEHIHAAQGRFSDLLRLRERMLDYLQPHTTSRGNVVPLLLDAVTLAVHDKRSETALAEMYRAVLAVDAGHRIALFHLESLARRMGQHEELAAIEDRIAAGFAAVGDSQSEAAFLTRAGETLVDLGRPRDAMQAFARAATTWPGHAPALEAWLRTALLTRSWLELAEVACRAPGHRGMVLALLREQLASETDPATLGELERSLAMAG